MFPLNWNIPFIRKNGSRTTLGAITGDIAGIEEDVADLSEDVTALKNGAGLPKQTLTRTLANGTITVTIPKNLGSSYAQGSLKLIGSNADSEAHVTFCLNNDNTSVVTQKLTNLGSKELTLTSATISGNNLVLVISGAQNYAWFSAEYFMSLTAGTNVTQPAWTFAGS